MYLFQWVPIETPGNTDRIGNVHLLQQDFDLQCFNLPALDSNIHLLKFNQEKDVQNKQCSKGNYKEVWKEAVLPLMLFEKARPKHGSEDAPMTFTLSDHGFPSSGRNLLVTSLYCCFMMTADPVKY